MAKIRVPVTAVEECSTLWRAGLLRWVNNLNNDSCLYPEYALWHMYDNAAEWEEEIKKCTPHILVDDDNG